MRVAVPASVQRTIWSPKWSSTRDHGPALIGTDRHAPSNFPLQVLTGQNKTAGVKLWFCRTQFREFGDRGVRTDPVDALVHRVFDFHGRTSVAGVCVHPGPARSFEYTTDRVLWHVALKAAVAN